LAILEAVAASTAPVPLKQLTDLIGIDRSSVFRLANTLRQRRFLANPKGSSDYILGPTAWRLSRRYGRSVLGTFFHPILQELTTALGETSHIAVREGDQAFFIDHHLPIGQVVSVAGQTGEFAPVHCTAHGKALLADFDLGALQQLLARAPLHGYTRNTITSLTRLARVCRKVRSTGFALDDGEYMPEVRCIAAPIRDPNGEIVASVGISSPITRLRRPLIARAAAEVVAAAEAITASLAD
jgi:IclR family acetate operon transcriptional repressor